MRVKLLLTCLCDAFNGEVGIATVRVLEHAGCEVAFPDEQTCCGQPPFNAGAWPVAREIATRCGRLFSGEEPVVVPSASCTAMLLDGYPMLGLETPRAYDLSQFMLDELGVRRWPIEGGGVTQCRRVAFHRSCHGRAIGLGDSQERLLQCVSGVELVPFDQAEQCCGFGGAFSASHGKISSGIGLEKLRCLAESGADTVVSGDMGCLMHLEGLIRRHDLPLRTQHYAQILAEAIPA